MWHRQAQFSRSAVCYLHSADDVRFDAAYQTGQLNLMDGPGERGLGGAHKLPFSLSYERSRCALLLAVDSRRGTTVRYSKLGYGPLRTIWVVGSNTVFSSHSTGFYIAHVRPTSPGSLSSLRALHARTMLPCLYLYILRFTSCIA